MEERDKMTDEQKKWLDHLVDASQKKLSSVYVIYRPSFGCAYESTVLLDRFPMSEKIHHLCQECKKGTLLEISDPIIFHFPWNGQDISLEELRKMKLMDSPQKPYLEAYSFLANMDYLEKKCEENDSAN